jgi:hypothetical protein
MTFNKIITCVGNERRLIDADVFFAAWDELAEHFEDAGLEGEPLDVAICDALPGKLLALIGNANKPH